MAKVEWHQGELFPRVGFIVTLIGGSAPTVVEFYNQRGTVEHFRVGRHFLRDGQGVRVGSIWLYAISPTDENGQLTKAQFSG